MAATNPGASTVKGTLPVLTTRELAEAGGSPYPQARFDRGDLYASLRRSLRRSLGLNVLLAVLALGLTAGLLHHAGRSKIVPYVVEVDRHGDAVALGPAAEMADPDRRLVVHTLALWVHRTRTATADRALQRKLLEGAYALSAGRALTLLNAWYQDHPPLARTAEETATVSDIESVLAAGTPDHWRLQWSEEIRNPAGHLLRREVWQALVEVEIQPPRRLEEVLANPLGIRVVDFDWQRIGEEER
jgi:type IV secretion system protein VirB5